MTRPSPEERISAFFEARGLEVSGQQYLRFDPDGPFTYVFSPDSVGVSLLVDRLRGAGLKRRVATTAFRGGKLVPGGLRVLPGISSTTVRAPGDAAFGLVIASARQLTLLAPRDGIAATVGWPDDDRVADEIITRRRIPDDINVPELIEADEAFPYFVTEYVDGRTVENPIEDWDHILNALVQLQSWYELNGIEWVETVDAVDKLRNELSRYEDDATIQEGIERLEAIELPQQFAMSETHGDLHCGNLRVVENNVYILDWEHTRRRYVHRDFVLPFLQWQRYGNGDGTFESFLRETPPGDRIGTSYAERIGDTAWDSANWYPGVVLFGLLQELALRSPDGSNWNRTHTILEEAVSVGG